MKVYSAAVADIRSASLNAYYRPAADFQVKGRLPGMSNHFNDVHPWDIALAMQLPGKIVLVGLAYFEAEAEEPLEQQQLFGRVVHADEHSGILLSLQGLRHGEQYNLPPDTRSFREAPPGEYRLRSTGEVVVDPDFTVTFSIRKQANTKHEG
jgi:hypothetical protein